MNDDELISTRLGGKDFFKTSYYKFEKFSQIKKQYLKQAPYPILDFGIGESDQMPPIAVLDELTKQAYIYENRVYADNGVEPFKEAAKKHLKEIYQIDCDKQHLAINHVIGAKSALCIIPFAFVSDKDVVICTTPGYQVLPTMAKWLKGKIYEVPLTKQNQYLPNLESIPVEIYQKTKIFLVNYPNSPTGAIATKEFYAQLLKKAKQYGFLIVNDCVYGPLTYHTEPLSIFSIPDSENYCIEVHSLSKAFNMTGFRIGFMVANEKLMHILKEVKDNMDSGQYIPIQYAAMKAFENESHTLPQLKEHYYRRLTQVAAILNKHHLYCKVPEATFYLYVQIPSTFKTAEDFTLYLLYQAGIYTIPWDEAEPAVRFAMTYPIQTTEHDFLVELDRRLSHLSFFEKKE